MAQQPLKIVENNQKKMPCNIEAEQAVIGIDPSLKRYL